VTDRTRFRSINMLVLSLAFLAAGCDELSGTNESPGTPTVPSGPATGLVDSTYTFTASATDPDGDDVSIRFDLGDGGMSEWSDFTASGTVVSISHSFASAGTMQVRAMARDGDGEESGWSAGHEIAIAGLPGWSVVGTQGFSAGEVGKLTLRFHDGTPYVAFQDYENSYAATVMYYNGTNWVNLGSAGFTSSAAYEPSFAIDSGGTPYVAYYDDSNKANVMKYNGSTWEQVGTPAFSEGSITSPSIAFHNTTPYVAYGDDFYADTGDTDRKAVVKMFNGTNWVTVGTPGFSGSEASSTSMAVNSAGTPYVAFSDWAHANPFEFGKATVMKFDGVIWIAEGFEGFSTGQVRYTELVIHADQPYLAYRDANDRATVVTYNGSTWDPVGSEGFSAGTIDLPSLTVAAGTPWISFKDNANSSKLTVMTFDGSSWSVHGEAGISPDWIEFSSIVIENGEPWVAFKDNQFQGGVSGMLSVLVYR